MESFLKIFKSFDQKFIIILAIKIVIFFIICSFWGKIIRFVRNLFERALRLRHVDELLIGFLSSLIHAIMYVVLLSIFTSIFGIKTTSLITILGTAGIAVGLALQGSLSNLAGGVLILLFRPFSKGDVITFDSVEGEVIAIQMMYTRLLTFDNQEVIVPNSKITNTSVTNFSYSDDRRLTLYYSASYDNNVQKVLEILNRVAQEEELILKEKPILIRLNQHSASSLDYIFRVWVKRKDYQTVKFNCNEKVVKLFEENDIEIPYNKLVVYKK